MALRDQPYIPLYIQDFLTDEKLMECSASATGIYIRIMCVLHKQNEYGVILLKQKHKQNDKQLLNFASQLAKFLPYDKNEIFEGLNELVNEGVLCLEDDKLFQKRMVKDNKLSIIRANSGSKGGKKTQFAKAKSKAKVEANTEYENENEDVNKDLDKGKNKKIPPTFDQVAEYCKERKNNVDADKFINFYESKGWYIGKNKMKDWKAAVRTWENSEEKKKVSLRDL